MVKVNMLNRIKNTDLYIDPKKDVKNYFKVKETTRVALAALGSFVMVMALAIAFPKTMLVAIIGCALAGGGMKAWESRFKEWLMPPDVSTKSLKSL